MVQPCVARHLNALNAGLLAAIALTLRPRATIDAVAANLAEKNGRYLMREIFDDGALRIERVREVLDQLSIGDTMLQKRV